MAIVEQTDPGDIKPSDIKPSDIKPSDIKPSDSELNDRELNDRELLHQFAQSKCQKSFTEVVKRHGGLVMGRLSTPLASFARCGKCISNHFSRLGQEGQCNQLARRHLS